MRKLAKVTVLSMLVLCLCGMAGSTEASAATKSVKSVSVSNLPAKTLTLKKGKSKQLKIKVSVKGKASKRVTFSSGKPKIVKVSKKGKVTAKKKGKATITVKSKFNKRKKACIKVTVGTPVEGVSLSKSVGNVQIKKTLKLVATVSNSKASNKKVVWSSSNKKIAKVNSKGVITGIKAGTVKITATAADGSGKAATACITVTDTSFGIKTAEKIMNGFLGDDENEKILVDGNKFDVVNCLQYISGDSGVSNTLVKYEFEGLPEGVTGSLKDESGLLILRLNGTGAKAGKYEVVVHYVLYEDLFEYDYSNVDKRVTLYIYDDNEIQGYIKERKIAKLPSGNKVEADISVGGGSGEYRYEIVKGDGFSIEGNKLKGDFDTNGTKDVSIKIIDANDENKTGVVDYRVHFFDAPCYAIMGTVTDSTGKPVSNARIEFVNSQYNLHTYTDSEGYYKIFVADGVYNVCVKKSDKKMMISDVNIDSGRKCANIEFK